MTDQKFGSVHTKTKLDLIVDYLGMYTTALSRQKFRLVYFDAFAGTGSVDIGASGRESDQDNLLADVEDLEPIIDGSAKRALQIQSPFDQYVFVESSRRKVDSLSRLKDDFTGLSDRISIRHGDANDELVKFCRSVDWRNSRAVVFLDPYGSQAGWSTVCEIARTRAIDLWYLFPSFPCVYRQISDDGKMRPEQLASIERILGTKDWRSEWIATEQQEDLFGEITPKSSKQVSIDEITRYMITRMKSEFQGGVLDSWLPLGPMGRHWYSLLFACGNPSPAASTLARKLASHLMVRS